nr:PEPxxWA-CTERM sorting domain-containing protein [Sphingomonas phyllosphaerae]
MSKLSTAAVPEPTTWAMMLLGFGVIGFVTRRRSPILILFPK